MGILTIETVPGLNRHCRNALTLVFFLLAGPVRKTVHRQLAIILPGSSPIMNYLRTFRTFYNFVWTLTDAAIFRLLRASFTYEFEGENFLNELSATECAIILTAHIDNYELGTGLFIEKFKRKIRMVRAPEPDELTAQHLGLSLERSSGGAVKIDYSTVGTTLSFDLLAALRAGQIISIQAIGWSKMSRVWPPTFSGDKFSCQPARLFFRWSPRRGFIRCSSCASDFENIESSRASPSYAQKVIDHVKKRLPSAMRRWSQLLEETVGGYWHQWYGFTPTFLKLPCYGLTQVKYQRKKAPPKNIQVSAPNAR